MRTAARAMARRAVAAHPHVGARPRNTRVWCDTREGGREIHHHPTSLHAGVYVRAQHAAMHAAAAGAGGPPRATELASSEQARRVRSGLSRELRVTAPEGRDSAWLRLITVSKKALSKLNKESRPRAGRWRCCTSARRQDETSMSTSVSPRPDSCTGGKRRPMALPPPLDSGGEGKQRVGAQSNGGGSSKPLITLDYV